MNNSKFYFPLKVVNESQLSKGVPFLTTLRGEPAFAENPVIPTGWYPIDTNRAIWYQNDSDKGLVIKMEKNGSEMVWIPVHTIGEFKKTYFSQAMSDCRTDISEEDITKMIRSVKRFKGFWIARYMASRSDGELVFTRNQMPLTGIRYKEAKEIAAGFATTSEYFSCLTPPEAWDTIVSLIKERGLPISNSSAYGNYFGTRCWDNVIPTGSEEKNSAYNIYDLAGNLQEYTTETDLKGNPIIRSGSYIDSGDFKPISSRSVSIEDGMYKKHFFSPFIGFRACVFVNHDANVVYREIE